MEGVASRTAELVDVPDFAEGVTATIPRSEFEAALASDEPAELFLEVTQPEDGTKGETRDVGIAWSRDELERLLEQTTGPAITLAFDRDELERILAGDVEAHGLREKAAILTVAAVAVAGAGAATASAYDEAGLTTRGITPSYVAVHDEATLAERGIEATPVSGHDEATLAARGVEPAPVAASHDEATLAARGVEPAPVAASHDEATLAARGIGPELAPAAYDEATLAARGIAPAEPATSTGDGGFSVDVPFEASTAAAVGGGLAGLGLLITAAGFAVRRQRTTHPA